jgi:hypothetical protein
VTTTTFEYVRPHRAWHGARLPSGVVDELHFRVLIDGALEGRFDIEWMEFGTPTPNLIVSEEAWRALHLAWSEGGLREVLASLAATCPTGDQVEKALQAKGWRDVTPLTVQESNALAGRIGRE